MLRWGALLLLVACTEETPPSEGVACAPDLYADTGCEALGCEAQSSIATWRLEIAEDDLALIIADPYEEVFVPLVLEAGGVRYQNGEIRLRGGSSRDYPKKSFRITFPEDAPHPGFTRKINLRAEYNDPTFMRAIAAHEVFRRFTGIPISKTRFIDLEINGQPYGLMLEIERVGKKFLEENGRAETSMYEADPDRELFSQGGGSMIPLPDEATYRAVYQKPVGTVFDYSDLIQMIESLAQDHADGGAADRVRQSWHVPLLLDYLAAMGAIQNLDHVRKNYYLSQQANGWEMYPWDLDLSFGCLYDEEAGDTICDELTHTGDFDPGVILGVEPVFPMEGHNNLLIDLTLRDPELAAGFDCRVCAMLDSPFWQTGLDQLIDANRALLEPHVEADQRDLNSTLDDWAASVEGMRSFAGLRGEHLRAILGCE